MKKFAPFIIIVSFLYACSNSRKTTVADAVPLHDSLLITSALLGEKRIINILTPQGYSSSTDSLPVLYMLDGGTNEDFPHVAHTINLLIKTKRIVPLILVGIQNTQRRRDLTGPTIVEEDKKIAPVVGLSQPFRNFIKEELFAEINKRYRTRDRRGIIGESLAGLFVMETLLIEPAMFNHYIAMDPSLWWNDAQLVKQADSLFSDFNTRAKTLWFAGSSTPGIAVNTEALERILKNKNPGGLHYYYAAEGKEEHHTIFKATKEKALSWTFGKKK